MIVLLLLGCWSAPHAPLHPADVAAAEATFGPNTTLRWALECPGGPKRSGSVRGSTAAPGTLPRAHGAPCVSTWSSGCSGGPAGAVAVASRLDGDGAVRDAQSRASVGRVEMVVVADGGDGLVSCAGRAPGALSCVGVDGRSSGCTLTLAR